MKKIVALLLAILMVTALAACGAETAAPAEEAQFYMEPLPSGIDATNPMDCTVPVSIQEGAFVKGEDGTYTATLDLFSMDLYDAVDFSRLKVGDMILIEGSRFVISAITETDRGTNLKGQFAVSGENVAPEDGYDFIGNGGGTMRIQGLDDHATYTFGGAATTKVADNFTLVDSSELGKDPVTLTGEDAIAALSDPERSFFYLNTTACYEAGTLTQMEVVYIP